jgi:hypothetical protein
MGIMVQASLPGESAGKWTGPVRLVRDAGERPFQKVQLGQYFLGGEFPL